MKMLLRSAFKKPATVAPQAPNATAQPGTLTFAAREAIAQDTVDRMKGVIKQHAHEGATASSTFIRDQLDPLDPSKSPNAPTPVVEVINCDAFTIARRLISEVPEAKGKTAVLNLASDTHPAGGWILSLSKTQVHIALFLAMTTLIVLQMLLGGSALLLFDLVFDLEEVLLSLAKCRPWIGRWSIFSWRRHFQAQSRQQLS